MAASQVGWECKMWRLHLCWGVRPSQKCTEYDKKLYLMVRLQFLNFEECWVLFHCNYSLVHSDFVVVPIRVTSEGQIEIFNHFLYLKPSICVQTLWNWIISIAKNSWNHLTVSKQMNNVKKKYLFVGWLVGWLVIIIVDYYKI